MNIKFRLKGSHDVFSVWYRISLEVIVDLANMLKQFSVKTKIISAVQVRKFQDKISYQRLAFCDMRSCRMPTAYLQALLYNQMTLNRFQNNLSLLSFVDSQLLSSPYCLKLSVELYHFDHMLLTRAIYLLWMQYPGLYGIFLQQHASKGLSQQPGQSRKPENLGKMSMTIRAIMHAAQNFSKGSVRVKKLLLIKYVKIDVEPI